MKLVNKSINRDGSVSLHLPSPSNEQGHVTLRPEDDEDMWHVYNLIAEVSLVSFQQVSNSRQAKIRIERDRT